MAYSASWPELNEVDRGQSIGTSLCFPYSFPLFAFGRFGALIAALGLFVFLRWARACVERGRAGGGCGVGVGVGLWARGLRLLAALVFFSFFFFFLSFRFSRR